MNKKILVTEGSLLKMYFDCPQTTDISTRCLSACRIIANRQIPQNNRFESNCVKQRWTKRLRRFLAQETAEIKLLTENDQFPIPSEYLCLSYHLQVCIYENRVSIVLQCAYSDLYFFYGSLSIIRLVHIFRMRRLQFLILLLFI